MQSTRTSEAAAVAAARVRALEAEHAAASAAEFEPQAVRTIAGDLARARAIAEELEQLAEAEKQLERRRAARAHITGAEVDRAQELRRRIEERELARTFRLDAAEQQLIRDQRADRAELAELEQRAAEELDAAQAEHDRRAAIDAGPLETLRYHVTGAIERGEAEPITEQPTPELEAERRARLEELRAELRAERISWGELAELQSLAEHIAPDDVELLEAAGVPEHPDEASEPDAGAAAILEQLEREPAEANEYDARAGLAPIDEHAGRVYRSAHALRAETFSRSSHNLAEQVAAGSSPLWVRACELELEHREQLAGAVRETIAGPHPGTHPPRVDVDELEQLGKQLAAIDAVMPVMLEPDQPARTPEPDDVDDEPPYGSFPDEAEPADLAGAPYQQAREELEHRAANARIWDDANAENRRALERGRAELERQPTAREAARAELDGDDTAGTDDHNRRADYATEYAGAIAPSTKHPATLDAEHGERLDEAARAFDPFRDRGPDDARVLLAEAELERRLDARVQHVLATDARYRDAETADEQAAAEAELELEAVAELAARYKVTP